MYECTVDRRRFSHKQMRATKKGIFLQFMHHLCIIFSLSHAFILCSPHSVISSARTVVLDVGVEDTDRRLQDPFVAFLSDQHIKDRDHGAK